MAVQGRALIVRLLGVAGAQLLSWLLAAPAMAQIEEIVVTAQKKSEDVQFVPIAITALSGRDLQERQVARFGDLQFATPNVSYTKSNFTGSDFQIRGIGITAVGYDAESGVAVNFDDVYLAAPLLADTSFYDIGRIEVLRGPQSTLYGRGAAGGVINVFSAKPDLQSFAGHFEASYGNYDAKEIQGWVNLPLIADKLALRLAGDWLQHSGYTTNVLNGSHIDDRDQYSLRGSLRWAPTRRTTIDIVGSFSNENDHKMRAQKQLCATDPTGTLGCLPDRLAAQPVNGNSNLPTIAASVQGMQALFGRILGPDASAMLGLFDFSQAFVLPAGYVEPSDPRRVATAFDPSYRTQDNFLSGEWHQSWNAWLGSTLVVGYDRNSVWSEESFNNAPAISIDPARLAVAEATLLAVASNPLYGGSPAYAAHYAPYFNTVPGALPVSGAQYLGLTGGNIRSYSSGGSAYDQSDGASDQYSAELRFNTRFEGPLNFMLAGYYLHTHTTGDYIVNSSAIDYSGIVSGALAGSLRPALCGATGCIFAPTAYHSDGEENRLTSKAIFGEAYYTAIADTLTFTLGLRWTEDEKYQRGRIALLSGPVPIGTRDEDAAIQALADAGLVDYDPTKPGAQAWQIQQASYRRWTGRFVADWTPKLDVTEATLIYASYARGYKAGGFNPGIPSGFSGVRSAYGPEATDAFELGTKNTLAGGTMQANGDVWYYNYKGLQVAKTAANTSVNENIDAQLWGAEASLVWVPTDRLQFDLALSHTNTDIGNSAIVDPRDPTNGYAKALLVKDATPTSTGGTNCVLYYSGAVPGTLPIGFFAPPGGVGGLASAGIAYTAYGACAPPTTDMHKLDPVHFPVAGVTSYGQLLAAQGFAVADPAVHGTYEGVPVKLKGHRLQNTPDVTISVGAQYSQPLAQGYNLVGRLDYYWQNAMFGRIFNRASDRIAAWGVMNAQLTLNAPDEAWYVRAFAKNLLNADNMTGMYVSSPSSGLYTNVFYGDPRTYGLAFGMND